MIFKDSYQKQKKILKQNLNRGDVVFDIGAREGQFTLLALDCVLPAGKVFAIEPDKNNFAKLKGIFTEVDKIPYLLHGDWLSLWNVAVGDRAEQVFFYTGKGSYYGTAYESEENSKKEIVSMLTLNDFTSRKVNMLIIDVCGSEAKILAKGTGPVFLRENPQLKIMMDFCPDRIKKAGDSPLSLLLLLAEHGYRFHQIMAGLFKDLEERSVIDLLKDDEAKWLLIKK